MVSRESGRGNAYYFFHRLAYHEMNLDVAVYNNMYRDII